MHYVGLFLKEFKSFHFNALFGVKHIFQFKKRNDRMLKIDLGTPLRKSKPRIKLEDRFSTATNIILFTKS